MRVFGDGDASLADALVSFTSRTNGGVNADGSTTNPAFDLIADPWKGRFQQAALALEFQQAQIVCAVKAFEKSLGTIRTYAAGISSERGIAFMLDVANQFGDGGLKRIHNQTVKPGMTEMDKLEAIADETVREMPDKFKTGVRHRRDGFLHSPYLSTEPSALAQTAGGSN